MFNNKKSINAEEQKARENFKTSLIKKLVMKNIRGGSKFNNITPNCGGMITPNCGGMLNKEELTKITRGATATDRGGLTAQTSFDV
jgi:hypothetical protein